MQDARIVVLNGQNPLLLQLRPVASLSHFLIEVESEDKKAASFHS
jgi:hypothetical protein